MMRNGPISYVDSFHDECKIHDRLLHGLGDLEKYSAVPFYFVSGLHRSIEIPLVQYF